MKKAIKYTIRSLLGLLAIVIITLLGYAIYMQENYYRIPDHQVIHIKNNQAKTLATNKTYTLTTYNVGFGAYNPKYSFFMDTGEMKNGAKTRGKYGTAVSKASELADTKGAIATIKKQNPDFAFFQEIDTNSTRSFGVNQVKMAENAFDDMGSSFAQNFHSAYIAFPLNNPHGFARSGILALSKYHIDSSERRKYFVSSSLIEKFVDLDRCFNVMRLPVKNDKELVLINSHMSAYDKGGLSKKKQLALLNHVMKAEIQKGNYVICGGDFNHAFGTKYVAHFKSEQKQHDWLAVLSQKDLASSGMRMITAQNADDVPTCRGSDIPYKKGVTYTTIVDGFLVSPNVQAVSYNIDTQFAYADHNPVKLSFSLR
ncbi:endonuclease [Lactobacillus jensenii]|jgi:endonuclease/exonuclease/phosphatase family protein|uniref:Endonuclease n=1 Tax=Lactobacillus jensenii TaxID=109790 RepID=A0A5N1ID34_LACJE|nr:endonuclease/exonuclease/phosphatase family protein [Lactobacillus jensenii]ERJ42227.1 endonuclease [Lactobacillus jensenii MD IIE-70(2)]APT14183.1 endonuclease [Lactobacillus jensenii]KAA9236415.1 endonuclease [Lactobacillus jensenii]KAA9264360.1 endonuclease [Lactobacillus jensenii]KAA9321712.1 endonuclease [Lactobacillus jensenii]